MHELFVIQLGICTGSIVDFSLCCHSIALRVEVDSVSAQQSHSPWLITALWHCTGSSQDWHTHPTRPSRHCCRRLIPDILPAETPAAADGNFFSDIRDQNMAMISTSVLLLLVSVACLARAAASSDKLATVITLNDANFDEILAQGDWVVDFMSPGTVLPAHAPMLPPPYLT